MESQLDLKISLELALIHIYKTYEICIFRTRKGDVTVRKQKNTGGFRPNMISRAPGLPLDGCASFHADHGHRRVFIIK